MLNCEIGGDLFVNSYLDSEKHESVESIKCSDVHWLAVALEVTPPEIWTEHRSNSAVATGISS